jgi:hypothetical protein
VEKALELDHCAVPHMEVKGTTSAIDVTQAFYQVPPGFQGFRQYRTTGDNKCLRCNSEFLYIPRTLSLGLQSGMEDNKSRRGNSGFLPGTYRVIKAFTGYSVLRNFSLIKGN